MIDLCGENTWIRCISHSVVKYVCWRKWAHDLPPKLLEEIYLKTIISQLPYCIAVWGNFAVAMFTEIVRLDIKVARIIHKIPEDILDCNVLDHIKWQDLGYLYKRRIAIEVFKVKQGLNNRLLPFLTFTKSKYKGPRLELKRKKTEVGGRNSFWFRAPTVWNSLDRNTRNEEKLNGFRTALKRNKIRLSKVPFHKGTLTIHNKDLHNFVNM